MTSISTINRSCIADFRIPRRIHSQVGWGLVAQQLTSSRLYVGERCHSPAGAEERTLSHRNTFVPLNLLRHECQRPDLPLHHTMTCKRHDINNTEGRLITRPFSNKDIF